MTPADASPSDPETLYANAVALGHTMPPWPVDGRRHVACTQCGMRLWYHGALLLDKSAAVVRCGVGMQPGVAPAEG